MKKLGLLLFGFAFIFTSCNNDDDSSSQDPLIGTWKFYKYFENNVEIPLEACDAEETLGFNANGTYNYTGYVEVDGNCEVIDAYAQTWSNAGNNVYVFDEGTDAYSRSFTFEQNTFYYTDTYFDGTENVTDKYVYIRQ